MSELKHQLMLNKKHSWVPVYIKSEADAVIADLEESHKKEVEQLLMEIVKLQKQVHEYAQGLYVIQARTEKEARHQKYKRCMAMAKLCGERIARIEKDYAFWRYGKDYASNFYKRWKKRWLELAEQFKEAK